MKKYIYIIGVALGVALVSCDLNMAPISDQSELNLGTSTEDDSVRIKFKDRAAMLAVYENLYNCVIYRIVIAIMKKTFLISILLQVMIVFRLLLFQYPKDIHSRLRHGKNY